MQSSISVLFTCTFSFAIFASMIAAVELVEEVAYCTDAELSVAPCKCCKMQCWYDLTAGEFAKQKRQSPRLAAAGDRQTMRLLQSIGDCVRDLCAEVCGGGGLVIKTLEDE